MNLNVTNSMNFRYKSDVDDNGLWFHSDVFPMWNV
jgi:hypothetical protein